MELLITDIREEAPDVKTFRLQPEEGRLIYRAGQFLTFTHQVYSRMIRRSYSLSGAPGLSQEATITVKRVPNGIMSRWLIDTARAGDVLHAEGGATGVFSLPTDTGPYEAVWLFAAGIGITPVYALLQDLLRNHNIAVVLVYSNRTKEETVFYEAIRELEQQFSGRLTIAWLWGNARDLRRARLSKESFPMLLEEYLKQTPSRVLSYVCGPTSYMWLVQLLLQDAGVPAESIRKEVFLVNKDVHMRHPADKSSHSISIRTNTGSHTFINEYPDSILRSAQRAGIRLPYSCETGQCGSCALACVSGTVWMSYNEVLTENDLKAGLILTCTGHAVGGDVVLGGY